MSEWFGKWIDNEGGNVWLLIVGIVLEYCMVQDIISFAKILFF